MRRSSSCMSRNRRSRSCSRIWIKLKNSSVATLSTENARLRAENQGLTQKFAQLQNENNQLREVNQQLTQQLQTSRDAAQQQQEQLQQMQTENQQAGTAPEPSAEQSMSPAAQLNACINNLRQIDAAKQQWALENDKTADAIPSAQELLPYFPTWFSRFALPAAPIRSMRSVCRRLVQSPATSCRSDPPFFNFHSWLFLSRLYPPALLEARAAAHLSRWWKDGRNPSADCSAEQR